MMGGTEDVKVHIVYKTVCLFHWQGILKTNTYYDINRHKIVNNLKIQLKPWLAQWTELRTED